MSLPAITRKTDKGLPQYQDERESDVYVLSGSEDLVPALRANGTRFEDRASAPGFTIRRYRPRIEGLFARVERWTNDDTGAIHWRSITRDNVTSVYGRTSESQIADSSDANRVFGWLISESRDDRGNAISYEYVAENDEDIDWTATNERNRTRTSSRYLKRVRYGNRTSHLIQPDLTRMRWMFELLFDYGEGHYAAIDSGNAPEEHPLVRATHARSRTWTRRPDPFSSHRAGFEVRTYRRCHRVLMFHTFDQLGSEPYLVRATEFSYDDADQALPIEQELEHRGSTRFGSFIRAITQSGFVRVENQIPVEVDGISYVTYRRKSLPALEFEYTKARVDEQIRTIAGGSENVPTGIDGRTYQWVDLDGEGVSGILSEQGDGWYYKPNLGRGRFGPLEIVAAKPNLANLNQGGQQLIDLAGDGQLDLVALASPTPGYHERTHDQRWDPFTPFSHLPNIRWDDPNLRFIDLNGDGHADVLVTEDDVLTWHASMAEAGFGRARQVRTNGDEEHGPRLVFDDGTQSIYLADMCGDGLTDLVRIRNGEVCYWPNQGYGRFGAKVTMDNAPRFDRPDQFHQQRLRLADIDGSGVTDIVYLGHDGVRLYFNQSGNRWSDPHRLTQFPLTDDTSSVMTADLFGNGTACLVWSSPLPAHSPQPLRYIDLMGATKPYLLTRSVNNLGAETIIEYVSATQFYLEDKAAGTPWITKVPFPVHVVERVVTWDRVSGNRFVTRYTYHHGYFDGIEREFRGFGRVDQFDTEELAALRAGQRPAATNVDEFAYLPPVLTRTWFHTGAFFGRDHISDFFAGLGDEVPGEYYREPGLTDVQAAQRLLDDTVLPSDWSVDEAREACRALKGVMLRQEVYAQDGTDKARHPYRVTEQNFTVRRLQPRGGNRHGVFFSHARETVGSHYERSPSEPRVTHALTLEADDFGNVTRSATVAYGRRTPDLSLAARDRAKQSQTHITYVEHDFTNAVIEPNEYRAPLPSERRNYELTGLELPENRLRFTFADIAQAGRQAAHISYERRPTPDVLQKRLIEQTRTIYRRDNLAGPLAPGELQARALPFEQYTLAMTFGLVDEVYGGRATGAMLATEGGYVHSDNDPNWWIPSGRMFYSPGSGDSAAQELSYAREHFYLPLRFRDAFHTVDLSTESFVTYDEYDLLIQRTQDALGNRVAAAHDYRVLQAIRVTNPNGNRIDVAFDALGMVVGTAVMGKPLPWRAEGDTLDGFVADLTDAVVLTHVRDQQADPRDVLGQATTRLVYDLFAYARTKQDVEPQPAVVYTLARETHHHDPEPEGGVRIQRSFSYSDGFGREIQKKVQAEAGTVPRRDDDGRILIGANRQPLMSRDPEPVRWVGSGWTVFNNKGKPVRQYEPFFTERHQFEFDVRIGVSLTFFYDPVERVVATLHPDRTWQKVVFDPWRQHTWDVSDTVLIADPRLDVDVGAFFQRLPDDEFLPSWYDERQGMEPGPERTAADKAAIHANTPTHALTDSLGRTFLTVVHNAFKYSNVPEGEPRTEQFYDTRVTFDIEGNEREVIDALDRVVMRYAYDTNGNRIHQASMEAGERWILNDVAGKPIHAWNSRSHVLRTTYDQLRRPSGSYLTDENGSERQVGRIKYGESVVDAEDNNLRGTVVELCDQAGVLRSRRYDFKGNLLESERELAADYKDTLDWSAPVPMDPAPPYISRTAYDALNRPVESTSPDDSIIRFTYNDAGLLNSVAANLGGAEQNGNLVWTSFVSNIDYDAQGRRMLIAYGSGATADRRGVTTSYGYDWWTSRLIHLQTTRDHAVFTSDCPEPPDPEWPGCDVQNLHYAYDAAGNITHILDSAQQAVYFLNRFVDPSATYTYDAVGRLIEATGREHLGQGAVQPTVPDAFNAFHTRLDHPGNGLAMGRYLERYLYDAVGNILAMSHPDPNVSWARTYVYNEPSQLEPAKASNRLTSTTVNGVTESYRYEGSAGLQGNITSMPHLPLMQWDYRDQLRATSQQVNHNGSPETTWYVYDATGQRVRKVTERGASSSGTPTRMKERIYLGHYEIYGEYAGDGASITLERQTLHVMDDKQRIALVETRTAGNDGSPRQLIRYQFGNHLGSSSLELDAAAQIISYEEYFPYGATSYQAVRGDTEASPKRYRYTAKGRDDETGLYYHEARFFAPWLARWTSCDPTAIYSMSSQLPAARVSNPPSAPLVLNVYSYVRGNPIRFIDDNGQQESEPDDEDDNWLNRARILANRWLTRERQRLEVALRTLPALADEAADALERADRFLNGPGEVEGRTYSPELEARIIERSRREEDLAQADVDLEPIVPLTTRGAVMQSGIGGTGRAAVQVALRRVRALAVGARRLSEIQAKFRDLNPTALLTTAEGRALVARGPTRQLPVAQRRLLQPGEDLVRMRPDTLVPRELRIHPDTRVLVRAHFQGLTPRVLAVHGQVFCAKCVETIEAFGGTIVKPNVAIFR